MRTPIRGEHVILQPVTPELVQAVVSGDLADVSAGDGWPHEDTLDGMRVSGGNGWVVVVDGLIVGDCGTIGDVAADGSVEIGYGLAAFQRGRGLGTEVVTLLADWLLSEGGATVVTADVDPDNEPSWRALLRAGFTTLDDRTYERRAQA